MDIDPDANGLRRIARILPIAAHGAYYTDEMIIRSDWRKNPRRELHLPL
jgi:hypothetical protein